MKQSIAWTFFIISMAMFSLFIWTTWSSLPQFFNFMLWAGPAVLVILVGFLSWNYYIDQVSNNEAQAAETKKMKLQNERTELENKALEKFNNKLDNFYEELVRQMQENKVYLPGIGNGKIETNSFTRAIAQSSGNQPQVEDDFMVDVIQEVCRFKRVVVIGSTDAGKTTLLKHLAVAKSPQAETIIALDRYLDNEWPILDNLIVCNGDDDDKVKLILSMILTIMKKRNEQPSGTQFKPLVLIIEELGTISGIIQENPEFRNWIYNRSRRLEVHFIFILHGTTNAALGSRGDREFLRGIELAVHIDLDVQTQERTAQVEWGFGTKKFTACKLPGIFSGPAAWGYAHPNLFDPSEAEQDEWKAEDWGNGSTEPIYDNEPDTHSTPAYKPIMPRALPAEPTFVDGRYKTLYNLYWQLISQHKRGVQEYEVRELASRFYGKPRAKIKNTNIDRVTRMLAAMGHVADADALREWGVL